MLILTNKDIEDLIEMPELIEIVERAAVLMDDGEVLVPDRLHLESGESTLLGMPVADTQGFGTKLVSVCPRNKLHGLPVAGGLICRLG